MERIAAADQIDRSRAALDSRSLPAKGGTEVGPRPTDEGRAGSKHHLVTDGRGIAVTVTGANVHDSRVLDPLLDAIVPVRSGRRGRPRRRPAKLHADEG